MKTISPLIARLFLSQLFLIAGFGKITGYSATQGYMHAMGVPEILLPLVILLEIGGGLAILVGWKTSWTSTALAIFSVIAAVIFHHNFADQTQMIMFMTDISTAGGLIMLAVHGAGAYSLDNHSSHSQHGQSHGMFSSAS